MDCSRCGGTLVVFAVPESYREYAPDGTDVATICSRCLDVAALPDRGDDRDGFGGDPDFSRISDAYPSDSEAGAAFSLLLGQCSSLARNREAIESLLQAVERRGTDPLMAIDRLLSEPSVEPAIDLARRRHQIEQLLY